MISQLSGAVAHVGGAYVVLDVAGVGYKVLTTPQTAATLRTGAQATLSTHLVVREDSLTLFGFATGQERDTFETLQSVQGVGPKLALAMLSVLDPSSLAAAVAAGDRKTLEKVPGVGAKVAARLLLELGGKLSLPDGPTPLVGADARPQVVDALVSLGWSEKQASAATEAVAPAAIAPAEVADALRAALRTLGGTRG